MNKDKEVDAVNLRTILRCNEAFFIASMMCELQGHLFEAALYEGQHQPATYPFMHAGYACSMTVNAIALRNQGETPFQTDLMKAVGEAVDRIPSKPFAGDLNDKMQFECGPYRFEFCITGYRPSRFPEEDFVPDPMVFPRGTPLGRRVELRVAYAA